MSFVARHLDEILATDWQTIAVIAVFCAFAAYFIKDYLAIPPLVIFIYPVLVLFSVLVEHIFIQAELLQLRKLDQWLMWTIIASICGTMAGTCLVAGLARLRERAGSVGPPAIGQSRRRPPPG